MQTFSSKRVTTWNDGIRLVKLRLIKGRDSAQVVTELPNGSVQVSYRASVPFLYFRAHAA